MDPLSKQFPAPLCGPQWATGSVQDPLSTDTCRPRPKLGVSRRGPPVVTTWGFFFCLKPQSLFKLGKPAFPVPVSGGAGCTPSPASACSSPPLEPPGSLRGGSQGCSLPVDHHGHSCISTKPGVSSGSPTPGRGSHFRCPAPIHCCSLSMAGASVLGPAASCAQGAPAGLPHTPPAHLPGVTHRHCYP